MDAFSATTYCSEIKSPRQISTLLSAARRTLRLQRRNATSKRGLAVWPELLLYKPGRAHLESIIRFFPRQFCKRRFSYNINEPPPNLVIPLELPRKGEPSDKEKASAISRLVLRGNKRLVISFASRVAANIFGPLIVRLLPSAANFCSHHSEKSEKS